MTLDQAIDKTVADLDKLQLHVDIFFGLVLCAFLLVCFMVHYR